MRIQLLTFILAPALHSCQPEPGARSFFVHSPGEKTEVEFLVSDAGTLAYRVLYEGQAVIDTSRLGFALRETSPIDSGWQVKQVEETEFSEKWAPVWGERDSIVNHYRELNVFLEEQEEPRRKMNLVFRAYDDGMGFRYEFPEQEGLDEVVIMDEHTEFNLTGDHLCWWTPGDWDSYEHLYHATRVSEIDVFSIEGEHPVAQSYIPENAVHTPLTMKAGDSLYLSVHEAALVDYAAMTLRVNTEVPGFSCGLVGEHDDVKVKTRTPFHTPWRAVQIARRPGDLIESDLIVNLNEPNKLEDVSWIKPAKYMGIWWEMHLGKSTWTMASGRHGATTANARRYIDFAAANDIDALLVEGWNTGWEYLGHGENNEGVHDFVTPYPDYDLREVVRYGKEKGVEVIIHHETNAAVETYERQLDTAFALCRELGIHAVKTGYVGKLTPDGIRHHSQWMVNHHQKVVEKAAQHQIMVNIHEPIKDTGLRRTYPNLMTREGLRGQEFNAWGLDGGNPPEHLPIVAFTRMLAGPIDYTPGIFNIRFDEYKPDNQVNTTLAHQLALYVVIYSPMQMAADLPEHYEGHPAFQFIRDVGVDWDDTRVLNGEIGDFVTIARKEKGSGNWFLGSITDEHARELEVNLDFLDKDLQYTATIYSDASGAHWKENPAAIRIAAQTVSSEDSLTLKLAPGGGAAICIVPIREMEKASVVGQGSKPDNPETNIPAN
jgi:glucan 1,4-alpha-glucosidase